MRRINAQNKAQNDTEQVDEQSETKETEMDSDTNQVRVIPVCFKNELHPTLFPFFFSGS